MSPVETEIQRVEISIPTPILDVIDRSLARLLKKNLNEIEVSTNAAIERGVQTDETARDAEAVVQEGKKAIKITKEVRLQFTRPIDEGKKKLMGEVEKLLSPLVAGNTKLDQMVLERAREIKRKEAQAQREYEEKQRAAEAKARAEEERREKISLAQGGDGNHRPVEVEPVTHPISVAGMRSTTRLRSIPDQEKIGQAVEDGIRDIPGVNIYQVWQFSVVEAKLVPKEYRRDVRG